MQLRIARHRQRELHAGRGTGTAPGQWDMSTVSGSRDAEWHRQRQHSPAVCQERLHGESRNENLNVCLLAAEDGTENKALIADGNEGVQDAVD